MGGYECDAIQSQLLFLHATNQPPHSDSTTTVHHHTSTYYYRSIHTKKMTGETPAANAIRTTAADDPQPPTSAIRAGGAESDSDSDMERELFGLTAAAGGLSEAVEEKEGKGAAAGAAAGGQEEEEAAAYRWLERLVAESAGVSISSGSIDAFSYIPLRSR